MAETQVMGYAINGIVGALLTKIVLKDFSRKEEIESVENEQFYPLSLYIDFTDYLEAHLSTESMTSLGRAVGRAVVENSFPPSIATVKEALMEVQKAHEMFCKPVIGKFEISEETDDCITMKYTAPYNCILQEGLLFEIAKKYGLKMPAVTHKECRRNGASECIYEVKF